MLIEDLGLSKKQLKNLIVQKAVDNLLYGTDYDENGTEYESASDLNRAIKKMIKERVDQTVKDLGDKHVLPNIANAIETLTLQKTNTWGEAKGKEVSFIEYLIERADHYMQEEVDYKGEPKGRDSYRFQARGTRIAHMIDKHLHYAIQKAMTEAMKNANDSIIGGIRKAIDIQLADIQKRISTDVKISR